MQTKFITLALSAILALSSVSVNALPAGGAQDTSVQKAAGQDVAATPLDAANEPSRNSHNGANDPVSGLIPEVGALVAALGDLVEGVGLALEGKPYDKNLDVNNILDAVFKLLGLKQSEGRRDHRAPNGSARTPGDNQPITVVVCFIENIAAGHSGNAAANNNPSGLISAVLALVGQLLGAL